MTENLPDVVRKVGGDLERVLSEVHKYTDARHPLSRRGQIVLARMIEDRPGLNTEPRIALLVDALAWHGVDQRIEFIELIDRFGIEPTYLAIDYLYEIGIRSHGDEKQRQMYNSMRRVRDVVELVERLRDNYFEVNSTEALSQFVIRLGGLDAATDCREDDLANLRTETA